MESDTEVRMTQNDLPTAALTTAGEKLARLGLDCPWVGENAWVHLETLSILDRVHEIDIVVPPAVAAAVVAFAGEVRAWTPYRSSIEHHEYGDGDYKWFWGHGYDSLGMPGIERAMSGVCSSQHAAAAALIIAVAEALEGE